jgi:hypothetical protein
MSRDRRMQIMKQVNALLNTSVDDMRSSLRCARDRGGVCPAVLSIARDLCEAQGQCTKVRVMEAEQRWISRNAKSSAPAARAGRKA